MTITFIYLKPYLSTEDLEEVVVIKEKFDALISQVGKLAQTPSNESFNKNLQDIKDLTLNLLTVEKEFSQKILEKIKQ